MKIAILTPTLVEGDAVSTDVREMARSLRLAGYDAYLSANKSFIGESVLSLAELRQTLTDPEDILIYHHSIGTDKCLETYQAIRCRKVVKYHNITPPRFFRSINRMVAHICEVGIQQIPAILADQPVIWVDSAFNGRELQEIEPSVTFDVLAPFHQAEGLLRIEPDALGISLYEDWRTNILMVGRVVPNKNAILGVDALAEYLDRHDPNARLLIVGDLDPLYSPKVLKRIRELELEDHVVMTGKVTLAQLKAFYLASDVFLTTSSHEGFCVPLVEAMGLRLPIVAVPIAAIPETAGEVALYAAAEAPAIADAIAESQRDELGRERRIAAGMLRYMNEFHPNQIQQRFLKLIEGVIARQPVSVA